MNGNNVKLMGLAAVVIIVCLLFSYLYMDDGSEDRREMQVGDYPSTSTSTRTPTGTAPRTS